MFRSILFTSVAGCAAATSTTTVHLESEQHGRCNDSSARPASFAGAVFEDRNVQLSADWMELPRSHVRWRSDEPRIATRGRTSETLVSIEGRRVVARSMATGTPAWARELEGGIRESYVLPTCDGIVALVQPSGITGIRAQSGEVLWAAATTPRPTNSASSVHAVHARPHGCSLVFLRTTEARAAEDPTDVVFVDTRSGRDSTIAQCGDRCMLRDIGPSWVVVADTSAYRLTRFHGRSSELPWWTLTVAGVDTPTETAIIDRRRSGARLRAVRTTGDQAEVWMLDEPATWLGRVDDTGVLRSMGAVRRIDLRTGRLLWTTKVGEADGPWALGRDRVALASRDFPPLLFSLDLDTGKPSTAQLLPLIPTRMVISDDGSVLTSNGEESVAVDTNCERPSIRERKPFERSVKEALGLLVSQTRRRLSDAPWPRRDARATRAASWLRSATNPRTARSLFARLSSEELAAWAQASPAAVLDEENIPALFERAVTSDPELGDALLLQRVVSRVTFRLSPQDASQLIANSPEWIRRARAHASVNGETCRIDDQQCLLRATSLATLRATRNALERHGSSTALGAFRSLIAPDESSGCIPSDTDAILTAALRHLFELSLDPKSFYVANAHCVHAATLAGPVSVLTGAPPGTSPGFANVEPVDRTATGGEWRVSYHDGYVPDGVADVGGIVGNLVLRLDEGVWRVVEESSLTRPPLDSGCLIFERH